MLGMGDLPSGSPDSRNDQPCPEMAVVLWDCCSAPCRVSLGIFGYPKIVIKPVLAGGHDERCRTASPLSLSHLIASPRSAASTWLGQLGPGDKRLTPTPDSVRPLPLPFRGNPAGPPP